MKVEIGEADLTWGYGQRVQCRMYLRIGGSFPIRQSQNKIVGKGKWHVKVQRHEGNDLYGVS